MAIAAVIAAVAVGGGIGMLLGALVAYLAIGGLLAWRGVVGHGLQASLAEATMRP